MRKVSAARAKTRYLWGNTVPSPNPGKVRLQPIEIPSQAAAIDKALRRRIAQQPRADASESRQTVGRSIDLDVIEQCLRAAYVGDMRRLTDLSRETIDTDPHLGAVLGKRFGATATMELLVTPATALDRNRDALRAGQLKEDLAKEIADEVQRQLEGLRGWKRILKQIAWGTFDGRAAHELVWRDSQRQLASTGIRFELGSLEWIHPRRLSFGPERELRLVNPPLISSFFSPNGYALRDVPHKFMTFTPQLFGDYPEREGLAMRCLYWSFFKRFGQRERMILLELFGKPWRWIEIDKDSDISDEGIEAALDFVENIPGTSWGGLSRGATMKVEALDARSAEAHGKVIEDSDKQNSKLVLGQTGTTDGESMGLNSSQARVMQSEQALIFLGDAANYAEVLEDGPARSIVALNWSEEIARNYVPGIKLRLPIEDRVAELARAKGALDIGLELAVDDVYEVSGFRKPDRASESVIRIDQPPSDGLTAPLPRPTIVYPPAALPPMVVQTRPAPAVDPDLFTPDGQRIPRQLPAATPEPAPTPPTPPNEPAAGAPPPPPPPHAPPGGAPPVPPKAAAVRPRPGSGSLELYIKKKGEKWIVYSEAGKPMGTYDTKAEAEERLRQIEHYKKQASSSIAFDGGSYVVFSGDPLAEVGRYATNEEARQRTSELEAAQKMIEIVMRDEWHGSLRRAFGGDLEAEARVHAACVASARAVHAHADVVHGFHVACARRPDTVYGALDALYDRGLPEMARASAAMGNALLDATEGQDTAAGIYQALARAHEDLDVYSYARPLERRTIHGIMLGALDSAFEREHDVLIAPAKFERELDDEFRVLLAGEESALPPAPKFASLPFDKARAFFTSKKVLPKDRFEQLSAGAKRRAFTVARMQSQQLLDLTHAELGRMIGQGAELKQFKQFAKDRLESAGWTPANKSHVETVFRTNVTQAHSVGRLSDMTQPSVKTARPYWQIRTVKDDRQRPNHGAVDGWVLRANDPFFERAFPGNYGFNCRCRAASLSERQVKERGLTVRSGGEVRGLPDPGFSGSGMGSLLAAFT